MKKLEELTIGQFIDLVCGNIDSILSVKDIKNATAMRNLIFEYKEIVDAAGAKQFVYNLDEAIKARMELVVFTICSNLVDLNEHGRAREVMTIYGINTQNMTDQRVAAEVKSRTERAKSKVNEIQNDNEANAMSAEDIRKQFDEQTAALMAYFKFQIDTSTMKATIYAHLVARHNREIKAKLAAMKR